MRHAVCYHPVELISKDGSMMMKRLMMMLGSVALLAVFSPAAVLPPQSSGGMIRCMGGMMGCNFVFSKSVRLDGNVESAVMAQGQGFPHFVLVLAGGTRVTVVAAPFWAVLHAKYKIEIGTRCPFLHSSPRSTKGCLLLRN
jgi:hypothetical protein